MKSIISLLIVSVVAGLWLSLLQPTHGSNLHGFEFPASIGLSSKLARSHLSKVELVSSKAVFMANIASRPINEMSNGMGTFRQLDVAPFYQAVVDNPLNAGAWNNLGYQLFSLNHYVEALSAYDRALMIDPDYSLGLANRCAVLSKLGKYAQALLSCQLAIEKDRHWGSQGAALAWDNQGDVLFNLQRYQESLKSFEQAIALNPDYLNARRNWAITQFWLDQTNEKSLSKHP